MADVDLGGWQIGGEDEQILDLTGIDFSNAMLDDAVLTNVNLDSSDGRGASLLRARLLDCTLVNTCLADSDLSGAVFRQCDLTGLNVAGSVRYRTQLLFSHPPISGTGVLIAPQASDTSSTPTQLMSFSASPGFFATDMSPDGIRILAIGDDGAQVWDTTTGTLTEHTGTGIWSPDGTLILTTGEHGYQIWDASTRTLTDSVTVMGAWSPDGTHILTSGPHGARQWGAETRKPIEVIIKPLPEGEVVVRDAVT